MTSSFFTVDQDGLLVVNEENLDRDPPNEPVLNFQVSDFRTSALVHLRMYSMSTF